MWVAKWILVCERFWRENISGRDGSAGIIVLEQAGAIMLKRAGALMLERAGVTMLKWAGAIILVGWLDDDNPVLE